MLGEMDLLQVAMLEKQGNGVGEQNQALLLFPRCSCLLLPPPAQPGSLPTLSLHLFLPWYTKHDKSHTRTPGRFEQHCPRCQGCGHSTVILATSRSPGGCHEAGQEGTGDPYH